MKSEYSLLSSLDGNIRAIDCRIEGRIVEIGCLCINAMFRTNLKDCARIVDLYDCNTYITTVELPQSLAGNKNGYLSNTQLSCSSPQN